MEFVAIVSFCLGTAEVATSQCVYIEYEREKFEQLDECVSKGESIATNKAFQVRSYIGLTNKFETGIDKTIKLHWSVYCIKEDKLREFENQKKLERKEEQA